MEWLLHFGAALVLGFAAAVLNCVGKAHGFSMDCVWQGIAWVGAVLGAYFTILRASWPGMAQIPRGLQPYAKNPPASPGKSGVVLP